MTVRRGNIYVLNVLKGVILLFYSFDGVMNWRDQVTDAFWRALFQRRSKGSEKNDLAKIKNQMIFIKGRKYLYDIYNIYRVRFGLLRSIVISNLPRL